MLELIFWVVVPILLVITLVMQIRSSCLELQQSLGEIKNKLNRLDDLHLKAILNKLDELNK